MENISFVYVDEFISKTGNRFVGIGLTRDLLISEGYSEEEADEILRDIQAKQIKTQLLKLEKQKVQKVLDEYGYNGLADVQLYASQNDEEAKSLMDWYQTYDDAIWEWIEKELPKIQSLEELINLDMKSIEQQIFQTTENLLPKED